MRCVSVALRYWLWARQETPSAAARPVAEVVFLIQELARAGAGSAVALAKSFFMAISFC